MKMKLIPQKFSQIKTHLKFLLPRIGLSLSAILLLLVLFELGLRFYFLKKPPIIFKMADSQIGYKLNQNYQGEFSDIFVKINSQGFRQENLVQLNKSPGTTRIVGLGDSVAFGFGVEEPKTYLRQLENLLNRSTDKKFEVINAAVTGYNTFQERKFLEDGVLKFKPDIIILSLVLNDIGGDFHVPNMVYRTLAPFKAVAYSPDDLNSWEKVFYFFFRRTYIYQLIHPKIGNFWGFSNPATRHLIGHYAEETIFFYREGYYQNQKYSWAFGKTEDDLLKISEIVRKNNIKLAIVIFPVEIQLKEPNLRKPQEILSRFCGENSLSCFDLINILERHKDKELFNDGIGHPNEEASKIIAWAIFDYLVRNNIISQQ